MPKVTGENGLSKFFLAPEDCEKFANMPDAELDASMVEGWRKSPVWAVMSKAIRANVHQKEMQVRDIRTLAEHRTWLAGYLTGLEFVHNQIWEAIERKPRTAEEGGVDPIDRTAILEDTAREIQKLEEDFR